MHGETVKFKILFLAKFVFIYWLCNRYKNNFRAFFIYLGGRRSPCWHFHPCCKWRVSTHYRIWHANMRLQLQQDFQHWQAYINILWQASLLTLGCQMWKIPGSVALTTFTWLLTYLRYSITSSPPQPTISSSNPRTLKKSDLRKKQQACVFNPLKRLSDEVYLSAALTSKTLYISRVH